MSGYRHDLTPFVEDVVRRLDGFSLGSPGRYRNSLDAVYDATAPDVYGCADAANIAYSLGLLPTSGAERDQWVAEIQAHQDPLTGAFRHRTHTEYHTTAQVLGALDLFDAKPLHPLKFLHPLLDEGAIEHFLDGLAWFDDPWFSSWDGAGSAAALAMTGEAPPEWFDRYFTWLDAETDPKTGFLRKGFMLPLEVRRGLFANLAGSFHYFFNYVYFHRPLPHPDAVIDTSLTLFHENPFPIALEHVGYPEVDWVFVINRAARQTAHRRDEVAAALSEVADRVAERVNDEGHRNQDNYFRTVHGLLGTVCTVAELQQAVPGSFHTPRPLRHVLDRRPFI
ncbi:hypothetical protein [Pseudonocardia sp. TRM90224]|uniref:hypothetical protein n=1 Tax=Pseudonocardia sp. TRM90224 TaxID=2812678 RepID=UPI001E5121DB|nr:hypothetical protein [Pseudonocardia sp. TRM90224]